MKKQVKWTSLWWIFFSLWSEFILSLKRHFQDDGGFFSEWITVVLWVLQSVLWNRWCDAVRVTDSDCLWLFDMKYIFINTGSAESFPWSQLISDYYALSLFPEALKMPHILLHMSKAHSVKDDDA